MDIETPLPILPVSVILIGFALPGFGGGAWQIRISVGPGFISPADLNSFLRDSIRIAEADSRSTARGLGFKPVRKAANFEAALSVPIEPRVQILAAYGMIKAETTGNEFTVTYPAVDKINLREDKIRDDYGRLGLAYEIPIADWISFRPYAAGELHRTSFEDAGSWTNVSLKTGDRVLWMDWKLKTTAIKPGFSAGLGIEIAPAPVLRLWADAGYRRAKITGFKGDFTYFWGYPEGGYWEESSDVPLYYYEFDDSGEGPVYASLSMPGLWAGHRLTKIRDAAVDLSGFYLKAGLGIAF
ncbi:MAG TPA: hypothetical protein PKV64_03895 [Candidatus Aminicenantes bacterium]|nr:hypothetical protein [Candidatus Aminicenantes bacterium]